MIYTIFSPQRNNLKQSEKKVGDNPYQVIIWLLTVNAIYSVKINL